MNSSARISSKVAFPLFCFLLALVTRFTRDYSMTNIQTDSKLIAGIARQDSAALMHCYKHFGPSIIHWIENNGGNIEQAKDIFQDGMIALYVNIKKGSFEKRNAKLSTYLMQICKYKWYDYLKSNSNKKEISLADPMILENIQDIKSDVLEIGQQKLVHRALTKLKNQCQKILRFFYWERLSMGEIAKKLSMQEASVKNGKYRCMQALKREFANLKQSI